MFKNKKTIWIILFVIVSLGAILRLWQLGNVPPSPDWDEAALGYDAYSIMTTGKDEFGKFLPVVLRSFDDYKPALYAYLSIPTVAIFGLNTFAVRLPSAISGILMIIVVFYLIRELFNDYKYRDYFSLAGAFLFAISPWSIQFSRVAFESNVGVLLNALTVLSFIKGLKKPWMLMVAAVFASFGPYVYQSEKVFTPLLVLVLVLIYWKQVFKLPKQSLIAAIVVGVIVIAPMVFYILTDQGALLRVKGTSIFSYQTELLKDNTLKLEQDHKTGDKLGLLLDNRRLVYVKTIIGGYLSHFDLNWLFIRGDITRHHAPGMGLLYLFEFPLILIGIYKIIFGEFKLTSKLTLLGWFLIVAIPASITTGVPHAVRTLNFLPIYQVFGGLGLVVAAVWVANIKIKKLGAIPKYVIFGIAGILILFNFLYYLNQYFVQYSYYDSADWQYGYKQAVDYVKKYGDKYEKIIVSDDQPMDKSYMFFLFYLKYPPEKYQNSDKNGSGSFFSHHQFGKFEFRPINWEEDKKMPHTLFIGTTHEISDKVASKTILNIDGTPAIRIADK